MITLEKRKNRPDFSSLLGMEWRFPSTPPLCKRNVHDSLLKPHRHSCEACSVGGGGGAGGGMEAGGLPTLCVQPEAVQLPV